MRVLKNLLVLTGILIFSSCEQILDTEPLTSCDQFLELDQSKFNNGPYNSGTKVFEASWNGECLTLSIGYSGCEGGREFVIVTNGGIAESIPVQLTLGVIDKTNEACTAHFTEELSIDLSDVTVIGDYNEILLNFIDSEYSYLAEF